MKSLSGSIKEGTEAFLSSQLLRIKDLTSLSRNTDWRSGWVQDELNALKETIDYQSHALIYDLNLVRENKEEVL
mgnify:CR=1 FL=1